MKKAKRIISIICVVITIISTLATTAFATTSKEIEPTYAISEANINITSNADAVPLASSNHSGVAKVELHAIGAGLVDADWSVIMSKGLLTNINMVLTIKHGFLFLSEKNYKIWRKANWTSAEYGSVQTTWEEGKMLKSDLNGTIEVEGLYDYPINTVDTGITIVK